MIYNLLLASTLVFLLNVGSPALAEADLPLNECESTGSCDLSVNAIGLPDVSDSGDDVDLFKGKAPRPGGQNAAKPAAPKAKPAPGKAGAKSKPLSRGKSAKAPAKGKKQKKLAKGKKDKAAKKKPISYVKPKNLPKKINNGQQGKHLANHKNFKLGAGKSIMLPSVKPQALLNGVHSGKHRVVGYTKARNHPVVRFNKPIGRSADGRKTTRYGALHIGSAGAHIVPHFGGINRP